MDITKKEKKMIVDNSKEMVKAYENEIKAIEKALKQSKLNKATAEALVKYFK